LLYCLAGVTKSVTIPTHKRLPHTLSRLLKVSFTDDVVTVKHVTGLMAADSHCYALRNACPNHIPYCGASEVMDKFTGHACFLASLSPRAARVLDLLAVAVEDKRALWILSEVLVPLLL
jgi:hypothetical protein